MILLIPLIFVIGNGVKIMFVGAKIMFVGESQLSNRKRIHGISARFAGLLCILIGLILVILLFQ